MNTFSETELSKQEALTTERLSNISSGYNFYTERPKESLIELMQWAKRQVISTEKDQWEVFIHNKISIDGSFLKFSEEINTSVKAIHTDAITSWDSDSNDEHFVGVGIFEVKNDGLKFYQCSLFHKGNQNEDEVSFFVIVKKSEFDKYLKFRNDYVAWQKNRDRETQEIEVIGGDPIPYDPNMTWDDLFLPEELKKKLIQSVEGFLNSKPVYDKLKVPWKMGLGIWGTPGGGKTTALKIIMAQYPQLKPVTIQPGHQSPDELLEEAFSYAEEHAPSLLFFEDLQELMRTIDVRHFLQLLDGVQKRSGILTIVTGNDFSSLEENIKSRPRRFDKFFEFPIPDLEQTKKYLAKYFGDILSNDKLTNISKKAVKGCFTYAHLQELYFNCVFIALGDGRETPSVEDVNLSMKQVSQAKKVAESDFVKYQRDLTDDIEDERDM